MIKGPENRSSYPITAFDEVVELPDSEMSPLRLATRPRVLDLKDLIYYRRWLDPLKNSNGPMPDLFKGMNRPHVIFAHKMHRSSRLN